MAEAADFYSEYDIRETAAFIKIRGFKRVALQFPDEILKESVKIVAALRRELQSLNGIPPTLAGGAKKEVNDGAVQLFVMADTTYGNCCVDEVGAAHANAECVVHYGPACFSRTSRLPAWFVFGKALIDVRDCAFRLLEHLSVINKPLLVLFSLEYSHAMGRLKEEIGSKISTGNRPNLTISFAEILCAAMDPTTSNSILGKAGNEASKSSVVNCEKPIEDTESNTSHWLPSSLKQHEPLKQTAEYCLGGLRWMLPKHHKMEDYQLVWIGQEGPALSNVLLMFNACGIARYDSENQILITDVPTQARTLKRRYYLVERAKDANIVGIIVGTLGIAGYRQAIHQLRQLIKQAGKKSYTFVMGRPNPAKLANFPECDVFVYVACAQTALLDNKEFFAPLITPFEAVLAFRRGSQWTGSYSLDFEKLVEDPVPVANDGFEAARFSFIKGGYVEDDGCPDDLDGKEEKAIMLASATEKALQLHEHSVNSAIVKGTAKSGAEYLSLRSYQGLEMGKERPESYSYIEGRSGKASGYKEEAGN